MLDNAKSRSELKLHLGLDKKQFVVVIDFIGLLFVYYLAFSLRFDGNIPNNYVPLLIRTALVSVLLKLLSIYYVGLHKSICKYAGISELISIVKAASISSLFFISIVVFVFDHQISGVLFPRSVFVIDWLLTIMFIGGTRFYFRIKSSLLHNNQIFKNVTLPSIKNQIKKKVLIYGAGDSGEMIARGIIAHKKLNREYSITGFIDDDCTKKGLRIHGIEVLGDKHNLLALVKDESIDEIILSIPSLNSNQLKDLLKEFPSLYNKMKTVPQLGDLLNGHKKITELRELQVEDLLGREKVEFNFQFQETLSFLEGKTVLITGAGGSIGSELCRQIKKFKPAQLILFGRGEHSIFCIANELRRVNGSEQNIKEVIGDVINKRKLEGVFKTFKPQVIFHAGADKHVPLMESNPDEAVLNNIVGTLNLLEIAEEFGAEKVVCISSDKAVNPSSVMGCCKRLSELLVQSRPNKKTVCVAVRFGNVLGSRGSVVPLFKEQIARGGPITVTHPEITRFFMTIPEAAQLVIQAGAMGKGGEIFILDMGKPIKIVDLAKETIKLAGYRPDIDIPIRFTGLRPGEKLYEELVVSGEDVKKTARNKIWVVAPNGHATNPGLYAGIKQLQELSLEMQFEGIIKKLQELVPEFHPIIH